jgi:hypothetical protein
MQAKKIIRSHNIRLFMHFNGRCPRDFRLLNPIFRTYLVVKVGQTNGVIVGRGRVASLRSLGSNCRAQKFWVQYVYPEHELP